MGERRLKLDMLPGTEYKNRNGFSYKCVSLLKDERGSAVMRRVSDGYILTAHGVREHEDGFIEWDYQTDGHWGRYWSKDGKYEEELERMESLMPDIGFTGNGYMDALIVACKLYYDAYNNGGCNIEDHYEREAKRHIIPLMPSFDVKAFISCAEVKMERQMDTVILLLQDKDLTYSKHYVICNDEKQGIKVIPADEAAETLSEGWWLVTFGDARERDKWISERKDMWKWQSHRS